MKESLCRRTAFWKWHSSTSFCKMVFSWVSCCTLAFIPLRARASALLLCFKETLIVEELSVRDREVSHTISIQGLIPASSVIILLPLPRIASVRLRSLQLNSRTQSQHYNSFQQQKSPDNSSKSLIITCNTSDRHSILSGSCSASYCFNS